MTIVRAPRPDKNYTVLSNEVLRDSRLSYRARGILVCILSRPDNWTTSSEALAREGVEGRDAIRTALQELEDTGYLRTVRKRAADGRWTYEKFIYETPGHTVDWKSVDGEPGGGEPGGGEPGDLRSNEKKEREEEPTPPKAARLATLPFPSDFGGSGEAPASSRQHRKKKRVHPDDWDKAPVVRAGDVMDAFKLEWSAVANDRPEFRMVPVYATEKACHSWLRNKFLAPRDGSKPWKPEDVLRLVQEFMRDVRYGAIAPKPGVNAWQMFQSSHTKYIHRVATPDAPMSNYEESDFAKARREETRKFLEGLT